MHCGCIPGTRISFFLDEGQGVPGDKVLLHPGDDTLAPQILKIQILIEKLAYNMCIVFGYMYTCTCTNVLVTKKWSQTSGSQTFGHKRPGHKRPPTVPNP